MAEKKKKRRKWQSYINIGSLVFILIVIYLSACVVRYVIKRPLAVYEVSNSEISDIIRGTGIILRTEEVYPLSEDGYVNSYLSDGDRVRNNGIVYILDKTGEIQKEMNHLLEDSDQTNNLEIDKIQDDLDDFTASYDDSDFYMVTEVRNELNHDIVSYTGNVLSSYKDELEKKFGKDCYVEVRSPASGLVSYSSDGLEGLTIDDVKKDLFDNTSHHMEELRTSELKKAGSNAYRLTTSQDWQIVLPLSSDDYERIYNLYENGETTVDIVIEKDDLELTVPFECIQKEDQGYVVLSFDNYVQRYLNQRYLQVKILLIKGSGLKIPSSSLVERQMFRIPSNYLVEGSNSNVKNHLNLLYLNKKGEKLTKQVAVEIVHMKAEEAESDQDETEVEEKTEMVSFFCDELKVGDQIRNLEENTTYTLSKSYIGYGVYTVNSGYAIFDFVDIVQRNEDYCIVNEETSDIELYDRIILNSSSVKENDIIY